MSPIVKGKFYSVNEIPSEYRLRKRDYETSEIDQSALIPAGWSEKRILKIRKKKIITRPKDVSLMLEDKLWCLFSDLGIATLSSRDLTLVLKRRPGLPPTTKQLDLVAVDGNFVFVAECKSQETNQKKAMSEDLTLFSDIQNETRNALKEALGTKDLEVVFIMATENIIWNDRDLAEAKERRIHVWDEYNILALQQLTKIAGEGAKYQVYSKIFQGKKIKDFKVRIPAMKGKMGGREFYTFVMSPEKLLKIAYVHHRTTEDFVAISDSYQRMIRKSRLNRIRDFINSGGFFPGNIIVNFQHKLNEYSLCTKDQLKSLECEGKPVSIELPAFYGSAWIIDGQHRLFGYADAGGKLKLNERLSVLAFVRESPTTQARIFVEINENQKAIEADLLWDLYEDLYAESGDADEQELWAASRIAKLLNSRPDSPLCGHVAIPKEQNPGNITLSEICRSLCFHRLITKPSEEKSSSYLYHKNFETTVVYAAERLVAYFNVIASALPAGWKQGQGHFIRTNAGISVFLGILHDLLECMTAEEKSDLQKFGRTTERYIAPCLNRISKASAKELGEWRSGASGQRSREIRAEMTDVILKAGVGFRSRWLEDFMAAKSEIVTQSDIEKLLRSPESPTVEFKGSLSIDIDRHLKADGATTFSEKVITGFLKTIVGMLNTDGGQLLVGVLEKKHYNDVPEEKLKDFQPYEDKLVIGLELEYGKDDWDKLYRKALDMVTGRIGAFAIDGKLVEMARENFEGKDLLRVTIQPSDTKCYLDKRQPFIRRGTMTIPLDPAEFDTWWNETKRKQKSA